MATVSYPDIEIAADGTVVVEGTRTKVVEIQCVMLHPVVVCPAKRSSFAV